MVAILITIITNIVMNRQRISNLESAVPKLEDRVERMEKDRADDERQWERARTIFCTARIADSTRARNLPDIGC